MMIEHTIGYEFYIIELCNSINKLIMIPIIGCSIFFLIILMAKCQDVNFNDFACEVIKWVSYIFSVCILVGVFLPSSSTLYFILAESVAKEVEAGKIHPKALEILDNRLETYLKTKEGKK